MFNKSKGKNKIPQNGNEIQEEAILKKEKSSLSEFVERSLPSNKEVEEFEKVLEAKEGDEIYDFEENDDQKEGEKNQLPAHGRLENTEPGKEEEIEESLSEIYQDEKGDVVDVSRLEIKKKRGFVFKLLSFIFVLAVIAAGVYGVYNNFFKGRSDATAVVFTVDGSERITAGETIEYILYYKNSTGVALNNVQIEASYPDNFIFIESEPLSKAEVESGDESAIFKKVKNSVWEIGKIPAYSNGLVRIKARIIDKQAANSVLLAKFTYYPENFSSEFKKEASFNAVVAGTGVDARVDYYSTALVGQSNDIDLAISKGEKAYFEDFLLVIDPLENIDFSAEAVLGDNQQDSFKVESVKDNTWKISNLQDSERELRVKYDIKEKLNDKENIIIRFEREENGIRYCFFEKKLETDVMKSDLNVTLIINGSKSSQPVNFGDQLNYSIVYSNKGETDMENVVMMAVLKSDFLDWTTLSDANGGQEKGNTVTWTKNEIPALAIIEKNEEGTIDFSINLMKFRESDLEKEYKVESYAQFSIGEKGELGENKDNLSNTIVNEINSDLALTEEVRYFSRDNIPVGTGPLPPIVGEATSFKVFWSLTNNLHELRDTKVELILPEYINWDDKKRSSVGVIDYIESEKKVVWDIGRLPLTVYRADAEFSISLTPNEDDRNKILVLVPGSQANATDSQTSSFITVKTSPKTTKLEDDEVASLSSDGRVQ